MTHRKTYQRGNVELRNGQWSLRYRELDHATGRYILKREALGKFKNKKAALKASEPIMVRVNERNNSDKPLETHLEVTFKQFVEGRWKAYTVSAKHQASTLDCYGSFLRNHLLPYFGERRLRDITPADISNFLEHFKGKRSRGRVSTNTLHLVYRMLRVMFGLAHEYDLIESSPVRPKIHRPETAEVEKPTLNAAQIRATLAALLNEQERLFALLISVTGMRLGEGLALRWIDFDPARCELQINHTLYRGELKQPKTESSRRIIHLAPAIAELLTSHRKRSAFHDEADLIFCREDGDPLCESMLRLHLYKAMDAAGIRRVRGKYGFHIFRHSAGSLIYARSRDLKLVQSALGHSNISTTSDIYIHLEDKAVTEGSQILAEEILANCDLFVTQRSRLVS